MAFLTRSLDNHVLTLTMSSPDTRNALTGPEQFDDIVQVCQEINDNMSIRAVVLTGEGTAFCAGGNVKDMRDRTGMFAGAASGAAISDTPCPCSGDGRQTLATATKCWTDV